MAFQTIQLASGANGRFSLVLRYNDGPMVATHVEAQDATSRDAVVRITDDATGAAEEHIVPSGWAGRRGVSGQYQIAVDPETGGAGVDGVTVQSRFWAGD